ncbi:Nuclear hormone receptor family member nhr-25 [Eumeta japonica]|uniref:Nuclear hormone receptor family member nhr-25 n=1 Tax=Eumeta variegata TaxID=151549 RepID=A0A4C1YCH1_EUMVA|nr:Nuclear hormone receptor family member nhr-25 [Eumeta japonica]
MLSVSGIYYRPPPVNRHTCPVCGDYANGLHYGIYTCESCKLFFKRSIQMNRQYEYHCRNARNNCMISISTRSFCRSCRFKKCLEAGMLPEIVKNYRGAHK